MVPDALFWLVAHPSGHHPTIGFLNHVLPSVFPQHQPVPADGQRFRTFQEFYPFYLYEHRNAISRRLHCIGTSLLFLPLIYATATQQWAYLLLIPIIGYGFAWVGHAFFEKNKPATFQYPGFSLRGDFTMWADILRGRVKW